MVHTLNRYNCLLKGRQKNHSKKKKVHKSFTGYPNKCFSKDNCLFFGVDFDPPFPFNYFMCRPFPTNAWLSFGSYVPSFGSWYEKVAFAAFNGISVHIYSSLYLPHSRQNISVSIKDTFSTKKGHLRSPEISRTTKHKPHQIIRPPWAKNLFCFSNLNDRNWIKPLEDLHWIELI